MDETSVDYDATWEETLRILRRDENVSERAMAFLTLSRLMAVVADTALVAAPSTWAKDLFEQRIAGALKEALCEATGRETRFAVTVDESLFEDDPEPVRGAPAAPRATADASTATVDPVVDNSTRPSASEPRTDADERSSLAPRSGQSSAEPGEPAWQQRGTAPNDDAPRLGRQDPEWAARESTAPSAEDAAPAGRASYSFPSAARATTSATPPPDDEESTLGSDSRLNAKYTFDTFVIGSSNRFAQAAASAVAEAPARAYNPLFIYGGSGLGKTHLLHAVGHYAQSLYPGVEVRYVNSEEFTNDFINSVQSGQFGKAQEFHRRYRDIDILLIDDIQFLQRAPETMEAFFHTFNTLHNADKQIVITSDLPPKQLGGFEDRMRSRFEMGLMTDVQPPDLETRIAILRKKVEMEGTKEVPRDVLEYIASRISTNIRELEGALIRVQALHSLSRQPMDVSLAESVLKDLLAHDDGAEVTASTIIAQTAAYFGLQVDQITGGARTRILVTARQIAMYLCRELTDMPLIRIGEEFGGRDHTTVMHANKKISELMKERRAIFNQVTELTARIKNSSSKDA
ncbi:chromosomal replication initiator protein DnaA [Brachybacterium endophyticum]|uniref:Chromosomal replication initiator protein DnaA n=1 Tax=Brachybacterium endophyticum TaxID=2182385 RepID=A0A2U2RJA1_9MICO|nr:chromosomal replication initiator protein DnaA [Brachybacterium endophyticum]PWH05952.1 chromosomal replication initiator protein DnaA [Brachybacterium endophyticum]